MRTAVLVATLALGCGRIGFDPSSAGDGGADDAVDAPSTGAPGPRWIHGLGASSGGGPIGVYIAGADGEVVGVKGFQTSLAIDGATLAGQSPFGSTGVVRFDASGGLVSTSVLDATGYCDPRGASMLGSDALVTGLTIGTTANAAFGACSIATNRQDPYVVRVERGGQQHLAAHWAASGTNAQGWRVAPLADGTMVMTGIYGADLTVGAPLPHATVDPSAYLTRFMEAVTTPVWAIGSTSPTAQIHPGPIATDANDTCALGAFDGAFTLFGQALPHAGNFDAWVARLDATGTARWVRAVGTANEETNFGNGSIATAPGGGCFVSIDAPGNLDLDGTMLPSTGGPSVLLHFDAAGTLAAGYRLPAIAQLARVGSRLYAALEITAPIAGYTPQARDVIVVELGPTGITRVVGALAGNGDQHLWSIAAIAGDAVAIAGRSTGQLVFGTTMSTSGTDVDVVGVLGL